jgi:hypothetical protein
VARESGKMVGVGGAHKGSILALVRATAHPEPFGEAQGERGELLDNPANRLSRLSESLTKQRDAVNCKIPYRWF